MEIPADAETLGFGGGGIFGLRFEFGLEHNRRIFADMGFIFLLFCRFVHDKCLGCVNKVAKDLGAISGAERLTIDTPTLGVFLGEGKGLPLRMNGKNQRI